MEAAEPPAGGSPSRAKIIGVQFGLLTKDDIVKMSVTENAEASRAMRPKDVMVDPKLGLPTAKGQCLTCNGVTVDQCQGHFGHMILPLPIFHPNHVEALVRVLRKICLNCGQPRKKSKADLKAAKSIKPMLLLRGPEYDDPEDSSRKRVSNQSNNRKRASSNISKDDVEGCPKVSRLNDPPEPAAVVSSDDEPGDSSSKKVSNQSSKRKRASSSVSKDDVDGCSKLSRHSGLPEPVTIDILSSDEEELQGGKGKQPLEFPKDPGPSSSKASGSKGRKTPAISIPGGAGDSPAKVTPKEIRSRKKRNVSGGLHEPTASGSVSENSGKTAKNAETAGTGRSTRGTPNKCKYCSASALDRGYPEPVISVHVPQRGRGKEELLSSVKAIKMSVTPDDLENLAKDFWDFVEGSSKAENSNRKHSRFLLPSEALKILQKIPERRFADLDMKADVARPEAFVIECIPIPPNCLRLQEDGFGSSGTNVGFKLGVDTTTKALEALLRKIHSIRTARFSKPTFQAALLECRILQGYFQLYLREKGAPKAAPGPEKMRIDQSGRFQNSRSKGPSRWTLDWVKKNVIGKRSCYSARNVVAGDPFLSVEEIGVPLDVAKHVTCSERVTELNKSTLQKYVEIGQDLGDHDSRACCALRIVRNGERREVTRKTGIELEIGDIVHRHLKDGDLVFINRPPSLHKHSLLALRARIQMESTWTINPAICAPLHADFDGDCLHVFVPQTEESKAELHQLMTLPAQILPSPEGSAICGISQDYILATYLLTSSPIFVTKAEMHQLGSWTTKQVPVPAIVKSPKGELWTGKQVIDLTIPQSLSFQSYDRATVIQAGEILCCGGKPGWLASTRGLVRIIAAYNPAAAVKHLDCSQSLLREWLLMQGFSVSLGDFYGASDHNQRSKMKQAIDDSLKLAKRKALGKRKDPEDESRPASSISPIVASGSTRKHDLESVAVSLFRRCQGKIGETIVESIPDENRLLAMVRSGSKGSTARVVQQIGSLGLQAVNGDNLLSANKNPKLVALAAAMGYSNSTESDLGDAWEMRGLVKSSLLDGLEPHEFFIHAISTRDTMFRQSQGIAGPGELFKKLMLFLRDVHIGYDGTVRNRSGQEIVQFQYEGAKSLVEEDNPAGPNSETILPGEPVGVLAATAISQPAYQIMLDASAGLGSRKLRPLDLLQESLFPRRDGSLKALDRRCTLRLSSCSCDEKYCEERRLLALRSELQPVTLEMLATGVTVEYAPTLSEMWDTFELGAEEIKEAHLAPWIGHIQLDQIRLGEKKISPDMILAKLRANCDVDIRMASQKRQLGTLMFCFGDVGDCHLSTDLDPEEVSETGEFERVKAPCLHFVLQRTTRKKGRNLKTKQRRVDDETAEMLDSFHGHIIPMILKTSVKGFEQIESTSILWEDEAWSTPRTHVHGVSNRFDGELVLEVTVKQEVSTARGKPWRIIKEACILMADYIDWKRSSPYSIQEIQTTFGLEAAQDTLEKRLRLAAGDYVGKKHLKLVANLLAHSGEIHGLSYYGYRDWMRKLHFPIPFTAGIFRAPMKNFMEGGRKGIREKLKGVLASSIFGERVPVGTGADFTVNLNVDIKLPCKSHAKDPVPESSCSPTGGRSIDILECLKHLNSEITAQFPPVVESAQGIDQSCEPESVQVECDWGSGARVSQSDGGWSAPDCVDGPSGIQPSAGPSWGADDHGSCLTSSEGLGWGASENLAPATTSPVLASGSSAIENTGANPMDAWGSNDCNPQERDVGASAGWGSDSPETANPDANWG